MDYLSVCPKDCLGLICEFFEGHDILNLKKCCKCFNIYVDKYTYFAACSKILFRRMINTCDRITNTCDRMINTCDRITNTSDRMTDICDRLTDICDRIYL